MATGHKIKVKGMRLDKSGRRLTKDLKQLDASAQAKAKGSPKVKIGKAKVGNVSKSSREIIEASVKRRAPLMKLLAKG